MLVTLPSIENLVPFAVEALQPIYLDRNLANMKVQLAKTRIGIYQDPGTEDLYMLLTDRQVHEHDRWLLRAPRHAPIGTWRTVPETSREWFLLHRAGGQPCGVMRQLEKPPLLSTFFTLAESVARETATLRGNRGAEAFTIGQTLALWHAHPTPPFSSLLAELPDGLDVADLHVLEFHEDAWRERHPEWQDMPRDMVLRMLGVRDLVIFAR